MAIKFLSTVQVDTDVLYVDTANDRVGIGTTNPTAKFVVADGMSGTNSQTGLEFIPQDSSNRNIIFSYDRSSGAYRELNFDASNFKFNPGGSTKMVIDSSGNVGIGTTSPDSKLNIEGAKNTAILTLGNTTAGSSWVVGDRVGGIDFYSGDGSGGGIGVKASISYENAAGSTGSSQAMVFRTGGNTSGTNNVERMRLQYNGNVGIGTDSPSTRLEVAASATTSVDIAHFSNSNDVVKIKHALDGLGSGITSIFDASNNEDIRLSAQSNSWFNSGSLGVGTTTPSYKLHVKGGNDAGIIAERDTVGTEGQIFMLAGDTTNVIASKGSGNNAKQLNFNIGIAPKVSIDTSGNVGIGTTSPSARLEVQGTNSNTQAAFKVTDSGDSFFEVVPDNNTTFKIGDLDAVGDEAMIVGTFSDITFSKGGTTTMILDSNNNVGIGTTSPGAKLDVSGSLRADSVQLFSGSTQYLSVGVYSGAPWINTGSSGGQINFGAPSSNTTNVYVQGTVQARDGLLGFVPTFVHGGFYHSSSTSSSAIYWIPSNYISETTSTQYYNRFVAPYPGRVKKVIMRWTNGATPTATSVTFRKTQNGGVSSTQYAATVTGGATTSMVATKEFSDTDFTFNAGDKYGLGFMTNGGTRFLYGMTYTLVIEYNI